MVGSRIDRKLLSGLIQASIFCTTIDAMHITINAIYSAYDEGHIDQDTCERLMDVAVTSFAERKDPSKMKTPAIIRQLTLEDFRDRLKAIDLKAEIWGMGGNLQAVGVRFGDNHALICDYATESGEMAALLMLGDDEDASAVVEGDPKGIVETVRLWSKMP